MPIAQDIDWTSYTVTNNQAEAEMVGVHILEIGAATQAEDNLAHLATEWRSLCVIRRNRMPATVLEAVYVGLDQRAIVEVLPKPDH